LASGTFLKPRTDGPEDLASNFRLLSSVFD